MNARALPPLQMKRRLFVAALLAALVNFYAFYPGLYHHDAWSYVNAIRISKWDNWQPPLLGILWIPLQWFWTGPQPMFAIFLAGYWSAFVLIALGMRDEESRTLPYLVFGAAFFPMALNYNAQLVKDIAMAISMLCAAGIAALLLRGYFRRTRLAAGFMWLFILLGGFFRANAVFGMPPLIDLCISAMSPRWRALGFIKRTIIAGLLSLLFIPAHLIADTHLFKVRDVKPISPLQIFDLGGITYFSGRDAFKGFFGPGFVAKNRNFDDRPESKRGCYTPRHWDTYGWDPDLKGGCDEVYENLKPKFGPELTKLWIDGILAEPRAYLTHRIAHLNRFLQFLCKGCEEPVKTGWQSNNQKEVTFTPNPVYNLIEWLSVNWSLSAFGPPYVYLLVCLAFMWASTGIRDRVTRHLTFALVSSGTLYTLALFVIGIAHEYRYIYWTMLAALVATPVVIARVVMRKDLPLLLRFGPLILIAGVIAFREIAVRVFL